MKRWKAVSFVICFFYIFTGCSFNDVDKSIAKTVNIKIDSNKEPTREELIDNKINKILNHMTVEQRIGQLMFVGLDNKQLSKNDIILLKEMHVGGVVLFDRNLDNLLQVKELTDNIQDKGRLIVSNEISDNRIACLPVFVALDQEGGYVQRMKNVWPDGKIPSQETLGSKNDEKLVTEWAFRVGGNLRKLGINVNFAPVADINAKLERSYGNEYKKVSALVDSALQGYKQTNVIGTLKHFPGMGRAVVDPHFGKSIITSDYKTLAGSDFVPFANAINHMDNDKFMIMMSHSVYTGLDEKYPASCSEKIITGILRNKMNYKGLVITDDIEMSALAKEYSFGEIGKMIINAGADIVLVCHTFTNKKIVYDSLVKAYKNSDLNKDRVDESVRRVIRVKLNL